ncbi:hypothetical protein FRB91_003466 [Serendipita sp. 411]|nr:hypothetical protein FRB91_003466 [Serendipita sp. 411]
MTTITDEDLYQHATKSKGKVVLITGAASGIGQAAAVSFAQYGAKVIIGDVDVAGGKHTVRECLRVGGTIGADAMVLKCDVTSWEDQVALFKAGYEKYGCIDYVVVNAGIGHGGDGSLALTMLPREPSKPSTSVVDVNLTGVIYTTRLAQFYLMKKNKSKEQRALIFIGSMAGNNGLPRGEIYCATKHAVFGLCRSLHDDFKIFNIRTAVITPWFIETAILPKATLALLAGIPKTPLHRVAGAIVNAATDPDWNTNGAMYTLPDEGPVFRVDRQEFGTGVYKLLLDRINGIVRIEGKVRYYVDTFFELFTLAAPQLTIIAFVGPILAYWLLMKFLSS